MPLGRAAVAACLAVLLYGAEGPWPDRARAGGVEATPSEDVRFVAPRVQGAAARTPPSIDCRLSFPHVEHRWMQVEIVFPEVGSAPLHLVMSSSSPGRYALTEFAKNVYDVRAFNGEGQELKPERVAPSEWEIGGHDGTVRVAYKVYGDRIDGTYLAIDRTHAHINMPAAIAWARGLAMRPITVRFEVPPGSGWKVATQLHPAGGTTFTAPNLYYLMDSPTELGSFAEVGFALPRSASDPAPEHFRFAVHHESRDPRLDAFGGSLQKIVREERAVFGELPAYEGGQYTFIADYLPWANFDGMEHRNSSVLTSPRGLDQPADRERLLSAAAHEFFHGWNVRRIRPKSLEPFDFEHENMSAELWLAEGFTSYYEAIVMARTGLASMGETLRRFAAAIDEVSLAPGRQFRSAADMSRFAPFVDGSNPVDRTDWDNTFISYYTWGTAIALGLDLSLRERTGGRVSLDDFMRAMWEQFGKPGGAPEGLVARPYTLRDARECLAQVAGDRIFADRFFDRYIEGREIPDYRALLAAAGFLLRKTHPGRGWAGNLQLSPDGSGGAVIAGPVPFGSPAYLAGLEQDDRHLAIDGDLVDSPATLDRVLERHRPGDRVSLTYEPRRGGRGSGTLVLGEDPRLEIVPAEDAGHPPSPDEQHIRDSWLSSHAGR